jgi:hypothetical protein
MSKLKIRKISANKKVFIIIQETLLVKYHSFMMFQEELPSSPIKKVAWSKYQKVFLMNAETFKNQ